MTAAQDQGKGEGLRPLPLRAENPEWKRGECPKCGSDLVSNAYWLGGKGYRIFHECVASLGAPEERRCDYSRALDPNGREANR